MPTRQQLIHGKAICVLAVLFCLFLTGCETKNVTPSWWHEAKVESFSLGGHAHPEDVVSIKKPLLRLMVLSILWSMVLFFRLYYSEDPSLKPESFFSVLCTAWLGVCLVCFAILLLLYMSTYGVTGTGYILDFSFLFFLVLGIAIAAFASVLAIEIVSKLFFSIKKIWHPGGLRLWFFNSNSFIYIVLLFLDIWTYIFTSRDLMNLIFSHLVRQ